MKLINARWMKMTAEHQQHHRCLQILRRAPVVTGRVELKIMMSETDDSRFLGDVCFKNFQVSDFHM